MHLYLCIYIGTFPRLSSKVTHSPGQPEMIPSCLTAVLSLYIFLSIYLSIYLYIYIYTYTYLAPVIVERNPLSRPACRHPFVFNGEPIAPHRRSACPHHRVHELDTGGELHHTHWGRSAAAGTRSYKKEKRGSVS